MSEVGAAGRAVGGEGGQAGGRTAGQTAGAAAGEAKRAGHEAARSTPLQMLGRLGLICRGVLYILIGVLAVQIAFGHGGKEASSTGALRTVAGTPFGSVLLWLLAVGFAGLALWQAAEAFFGEGREGWTKRLGALGRVAVYGGLCGLTVSIVARGGAGGGSNQESQGLTARALAHTGGRFLVAAVGLGFLALGARFLVQAIGRKFMEELDLSGASRATVRLVETLGVVGDSARGLAFGAVGVFLLQAAVTYDPHRARGLDGSLRAFAATPLGPWALVAVAVGLVIFGVFSCLQAWWQKTMGESPAGA